jgi:hypothetical protein
MANTHFRDLFMMKKLGITQQIYIDSLILTVDNKAVQFMQTYDPDKLDNYFKTEINKLTKEINKMGVIENIDYKVEVI